MFLAAHSRHIDAIKKHGELGGIESYTTFAGNVSSLETTSFKPLVPEYKAALIKTKNLHSVTAL